MDALLHKRDRYSTAWMLPMTDDDLPDNWQELDAIMSYNEAIREIGRRVREEGMPIPDCFLPRPNQRGTR